MAVGVHELPVPFRVGFVASFYALEQNGSERSLRDLLRSVDSLESRALVVAGYAYGSHLRREGGSCELDRAISELRIGTRCDEESSGEGPAQGGRIMSRESIVRELAVQSLQDTTNLEDHLQVELLSAAAREGVTLYEWIRERLLLKAGVASVGALASVSERLARANQLLGEIERGSPAKHVREAIAA